jgi:hypothetical protein
MCRFIRNIFDNTKSAETCWNSTKPDIELCALMGCLNYNCDNFTNKEQEKRVKIETLNNWINSDIISLMKLRDKSKKIDINCAKLNKSQQEIDFRNQEYRKLRNKTRISIRKAKANYIKNSINECKNDNKKLWEVLRSVVPSKPKSANNIIPLTADQLNKAFIEDRNQLLINEFENETEEQILDSLFNTESVFNTTYDWK